MKTSLIKAIHIFILSHSLTFSSFAHVDERPPVGQLSAIPGAVDRNRAGYGWLNMSSEAEAESFFSDVCPENGGDAIVGCVASTSSFSQYYQMAGQNVEAAFTELAKEKVYEYLIMNQKALGDNIGEIPDCLRNNPNAIRAKRAVNHVGGYGASQLDAHIERVTDREREILKNGVQDSEREEYERVKYSKLMGVKMRAINGSYDNNRLVQAYMLEKQLHHHENIYCAGSSNNDRMKCMSIRNNRERIRRSFPMMFDGGVLGSNIGLVQDGLNILETRDNCGTNARERFEQGLYEFLGSSGSPENISSLSSNCAASSLGVSESVTSSCATTTDRKRLICRGARTVNTNIQNTQGFPPLNRAYESALDDMLLAEAGDEGAVDDFEALRLNSGFGNFTNALDEMRENEKRMLPGSIRQICSDRTSLRSLITRYPHVVRQAAIDVEDSGSRNAIKSMMCTQGLMQKYQRFSQSHSCIGVTNRPDGTVHVERQKQGFPFVNNMNYDIIPQADGSYVVRSKMNYQFRCDQSLVPDENGNTTLTEQQIVDFSDSNGNNVIDPDEFDYHQLVGDCDHQRSKFATITAGWVTQAQTALTTAGNNITNPRVRFELSQCDDTCPATQEPLVVVSACYNHGNGSHDCSTAGSNWQDAGGYSLNTPPDTIAHETGHSLGLSDEYTADYYPAHAIGEYGSLSCNSTMGSTHNVKCHQYYPRHLSEMIRPAKLNCANGGSGPADSPTP